MRMGVRERDRSQRIKLVALVCGKDPGPTAEFSRIHT